MIADIKHAWVAALRSGQYIQGHNRLKYVIRDTGVTEHCCLGVLCDIYVCQHGLGYWKYAGLGSEGSISKYALTDRNDVHSAVDLTAGVRFWADILDSQVDQLIYMNDNDASTFETIANWIDANL